MARLLVVDDDAKMRRMLQRFLSGEGFAVDTAADIASARAKMSAHPADIVLLDLNLGEDDGLTLARELARDPRTGTIIISGKGAAVDRVVGLEVGADDYLAKPFNLRELLARIRALLRRMPRAAGGTPAPIAAEASAGRGGLEFAGWRFDPPRRTLTAVDGTEHSLTTAEHNLLSTFVRHPHQVLSRDQLMDLVAGRNWTPFDRAIDTQVRRLRQRLGDDGKNPTIIKTVRGTGYVFAADVKAL